MPQRYIDEVKVLVSSLLHEHEREGLAYSGAGTVVIVLWTLAIVDGLMRLGWIGG